MIIVVNTLNNYRRSESVKCYKVLKQTHVQYMTLDKR